MRNVYVHVIHVHLSVTGISIQTTDAVVCSQALSLLALIANQRLAVWQVKLTYLPYRTAKYYNVRYATILHPVNFYDDEDRLRNDIQSSRRMRWRKCEHYCWLFQLYISWMGVYEICVTCICIRVKKYCIYVRKRMKRRRNSTVTYHLRRGSGRSRGFSFSFFTLSSVRDLAYSVLYTEASEFRSTLAIEREREREREREGECQRKAKIK